MKTIFILLAAFVGIGTCAPRDTRATCRDRYIWVADGSVECRYLYETSSWGLHRDPNYWCNDYSLTDCCETCKKLRNEGTIN